MLIIQLGNVSQCRQNGVPDRGVFKFGVQTKEIKETYSKYSFRTKGIGSIYDIWNVQRQFSTPFKLELIKE